MAWESGGRLDQLICLTDFFATTSDILGFPHPKDACEDSVSFLPALHGKPINTTRNGVIHHSISGHFAYRQGPWKLILARGSGGWTSPTENEVACEAPKGQLYNLEADIGETENLFTEEPEIVSKLLTLLEEDVARGRSTAGEQSENEVDKIILWKSEAERRKKKQ